MRAAAEPEGPEPVRISLPRSAWLGMAAFALCMLGLLGVQVALIEDQRSTTDRQLRTAVRQANASLPLLRDAQPLVEEVRRSAPEIRRLGRDTRQVVGELSRVEPGEQLQAAGSLARMLVAADAGEALDQLRRLAVALGDAGLPRTVAALSDVAAELLDQQRLRRLLVRSTDVLGEIRARSTVEKATRAAEVVPGLHRTLRQSLRVQQQLLAASQRALGLAEETLAIARETERHVENLDRKLGGTSGR